MIRVFFLIQIDFAENFAVPQQDQIQSAYYSSLNLSIFTVATWFQGEKKSYAIVSENTHHNKEQIVPYLLEIFERVPNEASSISIWSDGPFQQFKNKYIFNLLNTLMNDINYANKFNFESIMWSYFATSHGKGAVDGIGAAVKMNIRRKIMSRRITVESGRDFVEKYSGNVNVILYEDTNIQDKLFEYTVNSIFENSRPIPRIASMHSVVAKKGQTLQFSSLTKNMI